MGTFLCIKRKKHGGFYHHTTFENGIQEEKQK